MLKDRLNRTTESQTHRELASGLSMPVGFKNGTDGGLDVAINALLSVSSPHSFLGISKGSQVTVVQTRGNACGHLILRGGNQPNYVESNIHAGNQPIPKDLSQLGYGISVTDACIDWETTERLLLDLHGRLKDSLASRHNSRVDD